MKFGRQFNLLKIAAWVEAYVDYDRLKALAEAAVREDDEGSDDSVSHTPRHTKAARALAEANAAAAAAAAGGGGGGGGGSGSSSARSRGSNGSSAAEGGDGDGEDSGQPLDAYSACRAAFERAAAEELAKASAKYLVEAQTCRLLVEAAGASAAAAAALLAADSTSCGCGAGEEGGASGGGGGGGGGAAGELRPHEALAQASRAVLEASGALEDLRGFCTLNLLAVEKGAKKFDKRWRLLGVAPSSAAGSAAVAAAAAAAAASAPSSPALPRGGGSSSSAASPAPAGPSPPQPDLQAKMHALCQASPLADMAALVELLKTCALLSHTLPPPPERRPAAQPSDLAIGTGSSSSSCADSSVPIVRRLDLDSLPLGSITRLRVRLAQTALDEPLTVPVLVARGRHAGPVLGITSAVREREQGSAFWVRASC